MPHPAAPAAIFAVSVCCGFRLSYAAADADRAAAALRALRIRVRPALAGDGLTARYNAPIGTEAYLKLSRAGLVDRDAIVGVEG